MRLNVHTTSKNTLALNILKCMFTCIVNRVEHLYFLFLIPVTVTNRKRILQCYVFLARSRHSRC